MEYGFGIQWVLKEKFEIFLQETEVEDERVRDTRGMWESESGSAIVRRSVA